MDISIHSSFLSQDDPDAALGFYRDTLGFEVRRHRRRAPHHRRDDGQGHLRQHPAGHQGPRRHLERLQASDAEIVQAPTERPYGVRDCTLRGPAGNLLRIQELR